MFVAGHISLAIRVRAAGCTIVEFETVWYIEMGGFKLRGWIGNGDVTEMLC